MTPTPPGTSGELLPSELCEMFCYDPETGELLWKKTYATRLIGKRAGAIDSNGRLRVEIRGRSYAAHHIAFAIHYGRWPAEQLDHINQDKIDNRIVNLREATNAENSRNRKRATGKSGYRGVSFHKGKYIARIMVDGKHINLGSFNSPEPAAEAYSIAAKALHGEFACPTS